MIRRIEALDYRCLQYVNRQLSSFQVLVGPNARGKSTFVDTVRFLGQLVSEGLETAVRYRTENLQDLLWQRHGNGFEKVRYEVRVHPRRDPGFFHEAPDILEPYLRLERYSMVVMDHEGSGQEDRSPEYVRNDLNRRLETSGWTDRTEVLVLSPELENWIWSDSPEVDLAVG